MIRHPFGSPGGIFFTWILDPSLFWEVVCFWKKSKQKASELEVLVVSIWMFLLELRLLAVGFLCVLTSKEGIWRFLSPSVGKPENLTSKKGLRSVNH